MYVEGKYDEIIKKVYLKKEKKKRIGRLSNEK